MLNEVNIMGRLVADLEIKATKTGRKVANFTIACDRNYVPKGEERKTDFIRCQAWEKTAEFIDKYFRKGESIILNGSLETQSYTDKLDNKKTVYYINVNRAMFAGGKKETDDLSDCPFN